MVSLILQNFSTGKSSTGIQSRQFWNCLGSWMLGYSSHSHRDGVYYSVKQFISFWTDLILRQLSLTWACHLLPCCFYLFVPVLFSGASWSRYFSFKWGSFQCFNTPLILPQILSCLRPKSPTSLTSPSGTWFWAHHAGLHGSGGHASMRYPDLDTAFRVWGDQNRE